MADPNVTAVICTRNRADFLRKCVLSLLKQTVAQDKYEILVVDNGSTDETPRVRDEFADKPSVRWIHEPVIGLSRARNTGWQNARGVYVGYIDDDATAGKRWVEGTLNAFESVTPAPVWAGGPIELEWECPAPVWINEELSVPLGKVNWGKEPRWLTHTERLGGGNSVYRRSLLEQLGGFDENLGRKSRGLLSGEETQFQRRVQALGHSLYYHPDIVIRHFVPTTRTQPVWFYRRYFWGGVSDYVQSRTLRNVSMSPAPSAQTVSRGGLAGRVITNVLYASGLTFNTGRTISGRVYWSYVLGRVFGPMYAHKA